MIQKLNQEAQANKESGLHPSVYTSRCPARSLAALCVWSHALIILLMEEHQCIILMSGARIRFVQHSMCCHGSLTLSGKSKREACPLRFDALQKEYPFKIVSSQSQNQQT